MFPSRRIAISGGDKFRDEHSLTFDGSDDYISAGDITIVDGLDDFSLGVWVKYLDDSSQSFIDKGGYAGVGAAFGGYYNETVDSGRFRFAIDNGLYFYYNASAQYLPQNQWHHTVVTYSNTNDRIFFYFNGIQITPTTNVGTYKAVPSTNHPVKIGINGSSYSNQKVSEAFIYNKELSPSEVRTLYNGREPYNHKEGIASGNLKAWWRMGDGVYDIKKGSLISDEVDSTLGSDLVTEGDFSNGGAAWTANGTITTAVDGGAFVSTGDADGGYGSCSQAETLTSGNVYLLTFDVTAVTGSPSVHNYCGQMQTSLGIAEVKTYTNVFLSDGTDGIDVRTICSNGQAVTINNIKFQLVNGSAAVMTNMEDDDFTGDTP